MQEQNIQSIAQQLTEARVHAQPVEQFSTTHTDFTRSDAYQIQEIGIANRVSAGEKLIGMKMGLTSEAKRKQMDLDSPLYGELTDKMQIENGGSYSMKGQIHPKIEPEVAFLIKDEIGGNNVTREQVLAACEGVYASLEILDSRYTQFKYFSMEDVISDNSSSSHFIMGELIKDFQNINLANLHMKMSVNGELAHEGNSSAISGDPVVSVIQLCELLHERGRKIPAGTIVLAGAATAAVALEPGMNVSLEVESLGSLSVQVTE
jgi:2-oxo-3-hexenedioate decarboxylase